MNELGKDALIAALEAQIKALESERDYLRSVVASRPLVIPNPLVTTQPVNVTPHWPFVGTGVQIGEPITATGEPITATASQHLLTIRPGPG